jgi:hypothetical protein
VEARVGAEDGALRASERGQMEGDLREVKEVKPCFSDEGPSGERRKSEIELKAQSGRRGIGGFERVGEKNLGGPE